MAKLQNSTGLARKLSKNPTELESFAENRFEYWGVRKAWQLARENPESIIAYFHTKGMSHGGVDRLPVERALTSGTFKHWQKVVQSFDADASFNKVGLFPSVDNGPQGELWGGWLWYNFWWARASYLGQCVEPPIDSNRWYYESWLCRKGDGSKDTYGCRAINTQKGEEGSIELSEKYYSPHDATRELVQFLVPRLG